MSNPIQSVYSNLILWLKTRFPETTDKLPAYAELIRLDKPIGVLLLLWPTIGALWIAAEGFPGFYLFVIFVLGTGVMRSAGCCINDYADSEIDGNVKRTMNRPLARGALTRKDALKCFLILSLIGFLLVLMTNLSTVLLAIGAICVIAIYPFMKRYTSLPQVVLGIAFSWGILMAFTAQAKALSAAAMLLFIANTLWTIAYDTQYAMVDREFDKKIGVKSTAILFDDADRLVIGVLQAMFISAMYLAGQRLALGNIFNSALLSASFLLIYQQILIRERAPDQCFKAFLNNNWVGAVIFVGILLSYL
tara:strand:+ start:435 stop:1352 length:918 start_codon:yes stop_codon:yes gene_type:complete